MNREWNVAMTMQPDPPEQDLMDMQTRLDELGLDASVSATPEAGQWMLSVGVEASTAQAALDHALRLVHKADVLLKPVAVRVETLDELARRAGEPTMPPLVGASEVADLLGVSRQRVHQLRSREGFPAPLVEVSMGPLWDERAVEKFGREWSRKPGRPATAAS